MDVGQRGNEDVSLNREALYAVMSKVVMVVGDRPGWLLFDFRLFSPPQEKRKEKRKKVRKKHIHHILKHAGLPHFF